MNIFSSLLIKLIKIYQILISPYLTPSCRYLPTCSEYTIDCLKSYGLIRGLLKATKRVMSCHPIKFLGGGQGFDPAVKQETVKK